MVGAIKTTGDEVIVPLPCYFNHQMWLSTRAVTARYLSFNAETAMPDADEARGLITARTRALLLVTPNNPSGAIYSPECIEQFFELAREHGIALITDETYRDFIDIAQTPHGLFARDDWRDTLVHLYSFSKVFSLTGFRAGAVACGPELLKQLSKVQDCTAICAPHAGQLAAVYGLHNLQDWKLEKSEELARRAELIRKAFENPSFQYRLVSAGAYFAYVRHPFDEPARDVVRAWCRSTSCCACRAATSAPTRSSLSGSRLRTYTNVISTTSSRACSQASNREELIWTNPSVAAASAVEFSTRSQGPSMRFTCAIAASAVTPPARPTPPTSSPARRGSPGSPAKIW